MKLYLSSYRIPETKPLFELFDKRPRKLKGAILTNAKDNKPPMERIERLDRLQADLAHIGLKQTVLVDLRKYDDPRELGENLAAFDYLYAAGGNNFDLRRAMRNSGFDFAIRHLLEMGQVYIGESAGAVVAGPSLLGFDMVDDAGDYTYRRGLGLIDRIIVPHNDSPDPRYANRAPAIATANPNFAVQPLNDNQALILNGDRMRVIDGV